jgi:hypothetical protein
VGYRRNSDLQYNPKKLLNAFVTVRNGKHFWRQDRYFLIIHRFSSVYIFNFLKMSSKKLQLKGAHPEGVCDIQFHPSGEYVISIRL